MLILFPSGRVSILSALAALFFVGCDGERATEPTAAQCAELSDHTLDLRLKEANFSPEIAARHRENLRATSASSAEWCASTLELNQVTCAMRAESVAALESCLPSMTPSQQNSENE
jgi:hypothetical protein